MLFPVRIMAAPLPLVETASPDTVPAILISPLLVSCNDPPANEVPIRFTLPVLLLMNTDPVVPAVKLLVVVCTLLE